MKKQDMERRLDHEQIRNRVGIFDFTMGVLEITGKDARKFLDYMCVNNVGHLARGRVMYTSLLNENGIMVDDVTVYCFEEEKFWLISPILDFTAKWLEDHRGKKAVHFENLSDRIKFWSVQGPDSRRLLASYLKEDMTSLKYYHFMENEAGGIPILLSRTGFTGELGYEIFADSERISQIVEDLLKAGKRLGVRIIESDVTLESIPTEKGLITAQDFAGCNPLEADLGFTVKWEKSDFLGKKALEAARDTGLKKKLLGFAADGYEEDIENESPVLVDGKKVGKVTRSNYGYTVEKTIGYVLMDAPYTAEGQEIIIDNGGEKVTAVTCSKVFYDPERVRINARDLPLNLQSMDTKEYLRRKNRPERKEFRGVFAAMATPMGTDENLDLEGVRVLVRHLAESGLDGILVGGSSGEYPALNLEERKLLFKTAVEAAEGKCRIAVCCSANSTRDTRSLCAYAGEIGADFILLMTPFDPPTTEAGLVEYYKELAHYCKPGVVIYHYPDYTNITLSVEAIAALARERNIVGIKNVADLSSTVAIINETKDEEFGVLSGTDEVFLGGLASGSDGFMGIGGCVAPKICCNLYQYFKEGKWQLALEEHRKLCKILAAIFSGPFPGTLKAAMELEGFHCGLPRRPAADIDMECRRRLQNVLVETGVIGD